MVSEFKKGIDAQAQLHHREIRQPAVTQVAAKKLSSIYDKSMLHYPTEHCEY